MGGSMGPEETTLPRGRGIVIGTFSILQPSEVCEGVLQRSASGESPRKYSDNEPPPLRLDDGRLGDSDERHGALLSGLLERCSDSGGLPLRLGSPPLRTLWGPPLRTLWGPPPRNMEVGAQLRALEVGVMDRLQFPSLGVGLLPKRRCTSSSRIHGTPSASTSTSARIAPHARKHARKHSLGPDN